MQKQQNIENKNWNLSLYDENNELINTININNDGTLKFNSWKSKFIE